MSQEINKHVTRAIVEFSVFLEFSVADALNSDAAMQGLEQLVSTLHMMDF